MGSFNCYIITLLTLTLYLVERFDFCDIVPASREMVKAVNLIELSALYNTGRNYRVAPSEFQPLWL
jgi:hypothetical protein